MMRQRTARAVPRRRPAPPLLGTARRGASTLTYDVAQRYHRLLGTQPGASKAAVRQAYIAVAKECHPDVTSDPSQTQRFVRVQEAYDALLASADEHGNTAGAPPSAAAVGAPPERPGARTYRPTRKEDLGQSAEGGSWTEDMSDYQKRMDKRRPPAPDTDGVGSAYGGGSVSSEWKSQWGGTSTWRPPDAPSRKRRLADQHVVREQRMRQPTARELEEAARLEEAERRGKQIMIALWSTGVGAVLLFLGSLASPSSGGQFLYCFWGGFGHSGGHRQRQADSTGGRYSLEAVQRETGKAR